MKSKKHLTDQYTQFNDTDDIPLDLTPTTDTPPKPPSSKLQFKFFVRLRRYFELGGIKVLSLPSLIFLVVVGVSIGYALLLAQSATWSGDIVLAIIALSTHNQTNSTLLAPSSPPLSPVVGQLFLGALWFALLALGDTFFVAIQYLISLQLRINLTRSITLKYMQDNNPWDLIYNPIYKLDNPDQRIANDIDASTSVFARIVTIASKSVVILIFLTYSYHAVAGAKATVVIYSVALGLMLMYRLLLKPLAKYTFKQERREGDFRYAHARIRDYAEPISFYEGQQMEKNYVRKTLDLVLENQKKLAIWGTLFGIYSSLNTWVPYLTSLGVNAVFLWQMNYDPTTLANLYYVSATYSNQIMNSFSELMSLGIDIAIFEGNLYRLVELDERIETLSETAPNRKTTFVYDDKVIFNNVTCVTPQNTYLVHNLDVVISRGTNVLITGPSGCGKSSLVRSLVGLWRSDGIITKPEMFGNGGVFYLPQKPYLVTGTLRDQVIYPHKQSQVSDAELLYYLNEANIESVFIQFGGWEAVQDWGKVLSPGEQQRLVFARLFYHRPLFAVLDESTSALDTYNEQNLYKKCIERKFTLISIAHKVNLRQFHDIALHFDGQGGYTLNNITEEEKERLRVDKKWVPIEEQKGLLNLHARDSTIQTNFVNKRKESKFSNYYVVRLAKIWKTMQGYEGTLISSILLFFLVAIPIIQAIATSVWPILIEPVLTSVFTVDKEGFGYWFPCLCLAILGTYILLPVGVGVSHFLSVRYRCSLMNYLHDLYFDNNQILKLNSKGSTIDNVDQRIAKSTADVTLAMNPNSNSYACFTLLLFNTISNTATPLCALIFLVSSGLVPPGPAAFIFGASLAALLLSSLFVYWMSRTVYTKARIEGDFRFDHIRLRENAEAVCFHGGLGMLKEKDILEDSFKKVVKASRSWIIASSFFNLVNSLFLQLSNPISIAITLWVLVSTNQLNSLNATDLYGSIGSLKAIIGNALLSCLALINILQPLSSNKGNIARIAQLIEEMEENNSKLIGERTHQDRIEGDLFSFKKLVCVTPTGKELNRPGITAEVTKHDRLLLMGPSGCGKSSLVRTLADIWQFSSGSLTHPPKASTLFLPQKPYMLLGTLRDQLTYPHTLQDAPQDEQLRGLLKRVNLGYLLNRYALDEELVWGSVLSPGEQQRLSFARLLYHSPPFAVLDEATNALDPANEADMYQLCAEQGIALISVGHRPSLLAYHNLLLVYDGCGGWSFWREGREGDLNAVLVKSIEGQGSH